MGGRGLRFLFLNGRRALGRGTRPALPGGLARAGLAPARLPVSCKAPRRPKQGASPHQPGRDRHPPTSLAFVSQRFCCLSGAGLNGRALFNRKFAQGCAPHGTEASRQGAPRGGYWAGTQQKQVCRYDQTHDCQTYLDLAGSAVLGNRSCPLP